MKTKASFGNGFGINRNTGGARSLPTAEPPLARISVRPGTHGGKYSLPAGGHKITAKAHRHSKA